MVDLSRYADEVLGIVIREKQIEAFNYYENLLINENRQYNLTALKQPDEIRIKHFLDSLTCFHFISADSPTRIVDVGTGAGFPGIPLKIVNPLIHLTLVESAEKKAMFCKKIVGALGLNHVDIFHIRAEEIGRDTNFRETFDWAVARAVAPLVTLSEYLLPLVKVGGGVVVQKGKKAVTEIESSKIAISKFGGEINQLKTFRLPVFDESRTLISILKIHSTPQAYPRRSGVPTKKPIMT